jgi:geranylgeranyl diphosphate synthase type II
MTLESYLAEERGRIDAFLDAALPPTCQKPAALHEAVRYTCFAGGKRFRPVLATTVCGAVGGSPQTAAPAAAAVEMIHVSSLIHDDLPCMDDAATRRGRPSCHRAFGEALAVLAGDWLLVHPFEVVASEVRAGRYTPTVGARVMGVLAGAVCSSGIIAGQVLDLDAESGVVSADELVRIHLLKTAALIEAAARVGAIVGDAPEPVMEAVGKCARALGLCFQVVDDVLDVVGDASALGKPTGSDLRQDKNTYVSLHGLDGAMTRARALAEEAHDALVPLAPSPYRTRLDEMIEFVLHRSS